jgi:hypothetical protein
MHGRRARLVMCSLVAACVPVVVWSAAALSSGIARNVHAPDARPVSTWKPPTHEQFIGGGLSFTYPSAWRAQYQAEPLGLHSDLIVALSNEPLGPPCRPIGANSITCGAGLMLPTLRPRGVFVSWTLNWSPTGGPSSLGRFGSKTRVGGRPARIAIGTDARMTERCGPRRATVGVVAAVAQGFRVQACVRDVNPTRFETQTRAMLRSVVFQAP